MKFLAGLFLFLCGTGILGWIAYNFFVEMQPAAQGKRVVTPLLFSTTLVMVGSSLMAQGFSLRGFAIIGGIVAAGVAAAIILPIIRYEQAQAGEEKEPAPVAQSVSDKGDLQSLYAALQEERRGLDVNDPQAVEFYNRKVQDYQERLEAAAQ